MRNLSYHRSFSLEFMNKLGRVVFWTIRTPFRLLARAHRLERVLSFKAFSVSIFCTECKLLRLWYFFIKLFFKFICHLFHSFLAFTVYGESNSFRCQEVVMSIRRVGLKTNV